MTRAVKEGEHEVKFVLTGCSSILKSIDNFDRGHPVVLILTIVLYIKQSFNTTFSMYLITTDI